MLFLIIICLSLSLSLSPLFTATVRALEKIYGYYITLQSADPGCRVVEGVGRRPLACGDCELESLRGHGCLSCECCALSGRGEVCASG